MMKIKRENLAIILVLILAIVLRFWNLRLNPVGLVHDEIHQLVNAKSLALTGQGAAGTAAGIFQNEPFCDGNCVFGELPSFLLIPFAFFKTTFPGLKIPLILANVLMIFWFIKFFENITKNKWIGAMVGLMITLNPWAINFGRTAYENIFSFMFYAWSFYLLSKKPFTIKNQVLAIVLGFAASLSYFGAKPIFVPLMFVGLGYGFLMEKKNIKKYIMLAILTVVLMVGYGIVLKNSYAGLRLSETKLLSVEIIGQVNDERRMSLETPVVRDIFINKYTVLSKILLKKYFNGLAPNYLFNEGELGNDHFMIASHPFMYLIDLPMIIVGFYHLALLSIPAVLLIVSIIFILPITPMLSNFANTYALRCGLLYPILAAMAGMGIYYLIKVIKNKKAKFLTGIFLLIIYLVSLTNFLVMYWYRTPFDKSGGWMFFERQAAKYIVLSKEINKDNKFVVTTPDPVDMIYEYAVFSGRINDKNFIKEMNGSIKSRKYEIDGIKFSKTCPIKIEKNIVYLLSAGKSCIVNQNNMIRIAEVRDAGDRWQIPNNVACDGFKLPQYPYPRKIEDFSIEKMDRKTFCETWISQTY